MAKSRQSPSSRPRPLSADFNLLATTQSGTNSSMLYSILPPSIQNRLPRLPSLRRSVSMYALTRHRRDDLTTTTSSPPQLRTTPTYPDDAHALVLTRSSSPPYTSSSSSSSTEDLTTTHSSSHHHHPQSLSLSETRSGIAWKFASQGVSLLSLAATEAASLSSPAYGSGGTPSFARQLYIHALTYLLRGLPSDLTAEEQLSVRSSLPPAVVGPLRVEVAGTAGEGAGSLRTGKSAPMPSVLHRTLASVIVQLFLLLHFLLPYAQTIMRAAYQYERTHRISERMVVGAVEVGEGVGRRGEKISVALWSMGLGEVAAWIVEGVAGGIQEGVGEGMLIVGARKSEVAKL